MSRLLAHGVSAAMLIGLSACTRLVGVDPALSAAQRDQAQREMQRPVIETDTSFETAIVESDVPLPREAFMRWFREKGAQQLGQYVASTAAVPAVTRAEPLSGSWRKPGDRRRVVYADGNSAVEEIVQGAQPDQFRYLVWNLTNRTGRYTNYAVGEFNFTDSGKSTRVQWTYSYRPKVWPDGFLIRSYVQKDYRAFMSAALTAMQKQATSEVQVN